MRPTDGHRFTQMRKADWETLFSLRKYLMDLNILYLSVSQLCSSVARVSFLLPSPCFSVLSVTQWLCFLTCGLKPTLRSRSRAGANLHRVKREQLLIAPVDRRLQGLIVIVPRGHIAVDIGCRMRLRAEVLHLLQTQRADRLKLFLIGHERRRKKSGGRRKNGQLIIDN